MAETDKKVAPVDDLDDSLYEEEDDNDGSGAISETWGTSKLSIIADLISQVSIGHDLSRVTLPTFLLEPWSLLEKFTSPMNHINLFLDAVHGTDPVDRMKKFVRWYVSGWYRRPKGVKKPYNPLLGEYFRCKWEHPAEDGREASVTTYIAEQVSHHPPITAFYLCNAVENFVMHGQIYPHSKFMGNSAASLMEGVTTIHLLDKNEKYVLTYPSYYVRGIILGKLVMETCGEVKIKCEETGMEAELDFKAKPWIGGGYNTLVGSVKRVGSDGGGGGGEEVLYRIKGNWAEEVFISEGAATKGVEEQSLFKVGSMEPVPHSVPMLKDQGDYESRRTWRHLTRALKNHDLDAATDAKTLLEEKQRRERSERNEREEKKGVWDTALFHLLDPTQDVKSTWVFNGLRDTPFTPDEAAASLQGSGFSQSAIDEGGSVFGLSPLELKVLKE